MLSKQAMFGIVSNLICFLNKFILKKNKNSEQFPILTHQYMHLFSPCVVNCLISGLSIVKNVQEL